MRFVSRCSINIWLKVLIKVLWCLRLLFKHFKALSSPYLTLSKIPVSFITYCRAKSFIIKVSLWEINDPPLSLCLQLALSPVSWSWSWRHLCPAWVLVLGSNRRAASCRLLLSLGCFYEQKNENIFIRSVTIFSGLLPRPGRCHVISCLENVNILFSTALNNGHSDERHLTSHVSSTRGPPPLDLEIRKLPLTFRVQGGRVGVWERHGSQILVKDLTS